LNIIPKLFELLHKNNTSADVCAYCCKSLNQLTSEITDTTQPTKKDVVSVIVNAGGLTEALLVCGTFQDVEEVIEQWFPLIDSSLDAATKLDSIGTDGIDKLLKVIPKHRFVIQVTGASILSKLSENDDLVKHLIASDAIPLVVKILGTESNLSKYEQKSREVSIKFLNKCATRQEGIDRIKSCGLPKILDAAMRGYGTFFIIQIQGLLLVKALVRDPDMKQQFKEANVASLLNFSASKHTVTRLQNVVKQLKEELGII